MRGWWAITDCMATLAIVWDEKNILTSLRLAFEADGYIVDTYLDPVIALPKVIFQPPSLLILNGKMPGMHGVEFFQKYREYSKAPVIFMSAWATEIEAYLARIGIPAEAYLELPFSQQEVVSRAKKIMQVYDKV